MRKYRLHIPAFSSTIVVAADKIIQCDDPMLNATIQVDFATFRSYCELRGWKLDPMLERPSSIEYRGDVYELHWSGDMVTRITLWHEEEEPRDITFNELPEVIRDMI